MKDDEGLPCKACFKCDVVKPLSEFYKNKGMADGHVNKCKECNKKDVREHREDNIESIREYDRSRNDLPHRVEARRLYAKTDEGKANFTKYSKNYRRNNPKKYQAHTAVGNALRDNKLTKGPCEECGTIENICGHHDDYDKPLEVRWLCSQHHSQWHAEHGEALNP